MAYVVVCQGKKCSRACGHDALLRQLCKVSDVRVVRCQGICKGSVVGAVLDGRLEWFERIDSVKLGARMKTAVAHRTRGGLPTALKKRRVKRFQGRPPRH
jgi:hypothetical protein